MASDKNNRLFPITETSSLHEEERVLWGNSISDVDGIQNGIQDWVAEILDIATLLTPDPEMWGDTISSTVTISHDIPGESNSLVNETAFDPTTIFEVDTEMFEESLREAAKPQPEREVDMTGMPTINWDFDKEDDGDSQKSGINRDVKISEAMSPISGQETDDPEKPSLYSDPFEQTNPDSSLEPEMGFYINRFREIFRWSEPDTLEERNRRYAKVLLYLLEEFDIQAEDAQKIKQRTKNIQVLRKESGLPEEQKKTREAKPFKKIYPVLSEQSRKILEERYSFYGHRYIFAFIEQHEKEIDTLRQEIMEWEQAVVSFQGRIQKLQEHIGKQGTGAITSNIRSALENADRILQEKEDAKIRNLNTLVKLYAQVLLYILEKFPIGGDYKHKNRSMQILFETLGLHDRCDELNHNLDVVEKGWKTPKREYLSIDANSIHTLWEYYKTYGIQYREFKKQFKQEQDRKDQKRMKQLTQDIHLIEKEVLKELGRRHIKVLVNEEETKKEREKKKVAYERRVKEQGGETKTIIMKK